MPNPGFLTLDFASNVVMDLNNMTSHIFLKEGKRRKSSTAEAMYILKQHFEQQIAGNMLV